jgi:hypothetical protein
MLPKPLYDALPYLYLGTGSLVGGMLESTLKLMPTATFMAIGMYVLFRRATAALEREAHGHRTVRPLPANYVPRMPPAKVEFCAGHPLDPHSLLRNLSELRQLGEIKKLTEQRTPGAGSSRPSGR